MLPNVPFDCISVICRHLSAADYGRLARVSRGLLAVMRDDSIWMHICLQNGLVADTLLHEGFRNRWRRFMRVTAIEAKLLGRSCSPQPHAILGLLSFARLGDRRCCMICHAYSRLSSLEWSSDLREFADRQYAFKLTDIELAKIETDPFSCDYLALDAYCVASPTSTTLTQSGALAMTGFAPLILFQLQSDGGGHPFEEAFWTMSYFARTGIMLQPVLPLVARALSSCSDTAQSRELVFAASTLINAPSSTPIILRSLRHCDKTIFKAMRAFLCTRTLPGSQTRHSVLYALLVLARRMNTKGLLVPYCYLSVAGLSQLLQWCLEDGDVSGFEAACLTASELLVLAQGDDAPQLVAVLMQACAVQNPRVVATASWLALCLRFRLGRVSSLSDVHARADVYLNSPSLALRFCGWLVLPAAERGGQDAVLSPIAQQLLSPIAQQLLQQPLMCNLEELRVILRMLSVFCTSKQYKGKYPDAVSTTLISHGFHNVFITALAVASLRSDARQVLLRMFSMDAQKLQQSAKNLNIVVWRLMMKQESELLSKVIVSGKALMELANLGGLKHIALMRGDVALILRQAIESHFEKLCKLDPDFMESMIARGLIVHEKDYDYCCKVAIECNMIYCAYTCEQLFTMLDRHRHQVSVVDSPKRELSIASDILSFGTNEGSYPPALRWLLQNIATTGKSLWAAFWSENVPDSDIADAQCVYEQMHGTAVLAVAMTDIQQELQGVALSGDKVQIVQRLGELLSQFSPQSEVLGMFLAWLLPLCAAADSWFWIQPRCLQHFLTAAAQHPAVWGMLDQMILCNHPTFSTWVYGFCSSNVSELFVEELLKRQVPLLLLTMTISRSSYPQQDAMAAVLALVEKDVSGRVLQMLVDADVGQYVSRMPDLIAHDKAIPFWKLAVKLLSFDGRVAKQLCTTVIAKRWQTFLDDSSVDSMWNAAVALQAGALLCRLHGDNVQLFLTGEWKDGWEKFRQENGGSYRAEIAQIDAHFEPEIPPATQ